MIVKLGEGSFPALTFIQTLLLIHCKLFVPKPHCNFLKVSMFEYNFNFVETFLIWCFQDFTKSKFIQMNFIYLKHEFFNIWIFWETWFSNIWKTEAKLSGLYKNALIPFGYIFLKLQKFSSIQRYPKLFLHVSNELLHFIFSQNIKYNILKKMYISRRNRQENLYPKTANDDQKYYFLHKNILFYCCIRREISAGFRVAQYFL